MLGGPPSGLKWSGLRRIRRCATQSLLDGGRADGVRLLCASLQRTPLSADRRAGARRPFCVCTRPWTSRWRCCPVSMLLLCKELSGETSLRTSEPERLNNPSRGSASGPTRQQYSCTTPKHCHAAGPCVLLILRASTAMTAAIPTDRDQQSSSCRLCCLYTAPHRTALHCTALPHVVNHRGI